MKRYEHGGNVWRGGAPDAWLDFSANMRPEGMPDWVRDTLHAAVDDAVYYPDPAMRHAREGLAQTLGLAPSCVEPTAGGIAALQAVSMLPYTQEVVATPAFVEYERLCRLQGRAVRYAPLCDGHTVLPLAKALFPHLVSGCRVWLCNPSNPLGTAFPRPAVLALLERVEALHGMLVVDEAFGTYCPQNSVRDRVTDHPALVVTGSLTKCLAVPGVRVGYVCAAPTVLQALCARQTPWALNCFAARLLCALPAHGDTLAQITAENTARRIPFAQALTARGWYVYPSEASYLLADTGRPVEALCRALAVQHILVRPCDAFVGLDEKHLRLAVKTLDMQRRLLQAIDRNGKAE
ncbi:MAG: histidinol-phosphate transaminase [Clostridia bacterium]